ncbi:MAG TPA: HAD family hydrolase [Blastocatellia bacterium]|jgi:phosphoglycolate phosphatase-like HAD superfamily hydrolase
MKLVIFDIDGTLTQTSRVDEICYTRAFAETHGLEVLADHWSDCPHVSDSGVTRHLFQYYFGREPRDHESGAIKRRLVDLLEESHRMDRSYFTEIPRAAETFNNLVESRGWSKAIATGCWRPSAEMKLRAASINYQGIPGGFAEDGIARESIVGAAISRSRDSYGRDNFDRIVSVGDGVWDVETAARLGLAFIGVAGGARAETLREAGAKHVIPNFEDADRFFECLERAEAPISSTA